MSFIRPMMRKWATKQFSKMEFPSFEQSIHESLFPEFDYFRLATVSLALQRIKTDNIPGQLAEVGVYQGYLSKVIHAVVPERKLYLFDTFEGFPAQDLERDAKDDARFKDTSVDLVLRNIGNSNNIVIRKGYVPDTLKGLEMEQFAFVMLDLDLYNPTAASLAFFYPRLAPGGYLFVHDYNSAESNWAGRRAFDEFLREKKEKVIEIADKAGTALIRKI